MIIEGLINLLFGLLDVLFGNVNIDISAATNVTDTLFDVFRVAGFLLPMGTITTIFAITILLFNFRIVIAILKALWSIIPLL